MMSQLPAQEIRSTSVATHSTWQERLLPVMVMMTIGMTLFFLVASIVQLNSLNEAIQNTAEIDLSGLIEQPTTTADERADTQLRSLLIMEANLIGRRHHEANVALMARIWTRYMGFLTGMSLTMVGAAFILGRLSSSHSALSSGVGKVSIELKSASPGLFMIVLGAILMIVTITNHPRINVVDKAIFVSPMEGFRTSRLGVMPNDSTPNTGAQAPKPELPSWPEVEK